MCLSVTKKAAGSGGKNPVCTGSAGVGHSSIPKILPSLAVWPFRASVSLPAQWSDVSPSEVDAYRGSGMWPGAELTQPGSTPATLPAILLIGLILVQLGLETAEILYFQ